MLLLIMISGCTTKKDEEEQVDLPEVHYTLLNVTMGEYDVYQKWFTYPDDYVKCVTEEIFTLEVDEYYEQEFTFDCSGTGLVIMVDDDYVFIDKAFETEILTTEDISSANLGVIIDKLANRKITTIENALYINENSEFINYVKTMYVVDGHDIYELRIKSGSQLNDTCIGFEDDVHPFVMGEEIIEVSYKSCVSLGVYVDFNGNLFRVDQMINTKDMTIEEFISVGIDFS